MRSFVSFVAVMTLALSVVGRAMGAIEYELTGLGTLGGNSSYADCINNKGQIGGISTDAGGNEQAFLYSGGVMTELPMPSVPADFAPNGIEINDNGQFLLEGYSETDGGLNYLYSGGTYTDIGQAVAGGSAISINDAGTVAGVAEPGYEPYPFLYNAGALTLVNVPNSIGSDGYAINNRGVMAGTFLDPEINFHLFTYHNGVVTDLGDFAGTGIYVMSVNGINEKDQIIGLCSGPHGMDAYLYHDGTITDIGTLGGEQTQAFGINDSGQVVGESIVSGIDFTTNAAYIYSDGVMTNLNALIDPSLGWNLTAANSINDAGEIVGSGVNPEGQEEAYLLTPLPEPAAFPLFLAATLILASRLPPGR